MKGSIVTTSDLISLIQRDPIRMNILRQVQTLDLPDCWVAAGFVRSAVWDHLHGRRSSPLRSDVDVIWFDSDNHEAERDVKLEARLCTLDSTVDWSVKNQARMHLRNHDAPYTSAVQAMTCWPETATAVGVRLNREGKVEVAAPLGLDDLFALIVRPTPRFEGDKYGTYLKRIQSKQWHTLWPRLVYLG